jgi:BON domain-containing protein
MAALSRLKTTQIRPPNPSLHQKAEQLQQAFATSSYPPLQRVSVEFDDGCLILRGVVNSFHLKQVAQAVAVKAIEGIRLVNHLDVKAANRRPQTSERN